MARFILISSPGQPRFRARSLSSPLRYPDRVSSLGCLREFIFPLILDSVSLSAIGPILATPCSFEGRVFPPRKHKFYISPPLTLRPSTRIRVIAICQREERIRYSTNKPRHYSTFCSHLDRSYIRSSREIAFEINLFPVESKRTTVKNPPLSRNRSDRIEKVSDARSSCTLEKGQTDFDSVGWERERETSEQRSWLESPAAGCFGVGRRKEESGIVLKQG